MKLSLTEIYNLLIESKKTEAYARNVVLNINPDYENVDALINALKEIDGSQNQKNLPAMAYLNVKQDMLLFDDTKIAFDLYNTLLEKNKIKPLQFTDNGIQIESSVCTDINCFYNTLEQIYKAVPIDVDTEEEEVEVENSDPIFKNDKVEIYDGNSVGSCIKYTVGKEITDKQYNFCIGQKRNVRHQGYRDLKASTFYYIFDKTRDVDKDPLHMVVYDHTTNGVELTDENNHTGNISEFGSDVEAYQKYLKSLGVDYDKLMPHKPHSPEEEFERRRLGRENGDLKWFMSLSYKEKKRYIGRGHPLSNEQFDLLIKYNSKELLQHYADANAILEPHQLEKLNSNLLKTYFRRRFMQFEESFLYDLNEHEIDFITPGIFKGYLHVVKNKNHGIMSKDVKDLLTPKLKYMYYDQYFTMGKTLRWEELKDMDLEIKKLFAKSLAHDEQYLGKENFGALEPEVKEVYYEERIKVGKHIDLDILKSLPEKYIRQFYEKALNSDYHFTKKDFLIIPEDLKRRALLKEYTTGEYKLREDVIKLPLDIQKAYIKARTKSGEIAKSEVNGLDEEVQKIYWDWAIETGEKYISKSDIEHLGKEMVEKFFVTKIKNDGFVTKSEYEQLPQELKDAIDKAKIEKGEHIPHGQLERMSKELQELYYEVRINDDKDVFLRGKELHKLPKDLRNRYFDKKIEASEKPYFTEQELLIMSDKLIKKYLDKKIKNEHTLYTHEEELLTEKQKLMIKVKKLYDKEGFYLEDDEFEKVPLKHKRKHVDNLLDDNIGLSVEEYKAATPKQKWRMLKRFIDDDLNIRSYWDETPDKLKDKVNEYMN